MPYCTPTQQNNKMFLKNGVLSISHKYYQTILKLSQYADGSEEIFFLQA
jgi:hypothetical protein